MSKELSFDLKSLPNQAAAIIQKVKPSLPLLFLLFVVMVYGYLFMSINSLQNIQPSQVASSGPVTATTSPHIDPKLVAQLQQLNNNSVAVKALFDQSRSNPFDQCTTQQAAQNQCQPQLIEVHQ